MNSWLLAESQRVGVLRRLLSEGGLIKKIRLYEKEHNNRKTLVEYLDRKAQPHRTPHRQGQGGVLGSQRPVTTLVRWGHDKRTRGGA